MSVQDMGVGTGGWGNREIILVERLLFFHSLQCILNERFTRTVSVRNFAIQSRPHKIRTRLDLFGSTVDFTGQVKCTISQGDSFSSITSLLF